MTNKNPFCCFIVSTILDIWQASNATLINQIKNEQLRVKEEIQDAILKIDKTFEAEVLLFI